VKSLCNKAINVCSKYVLSNSPSLKLLHFPTKEKLRKKKRNKQKKKKNKKKKKETHKKKIVKWILKVTASKRKNESFIQNFKE